MQIFTYVFILLIGAFLVKKNLIPDSIKKRLGLFQTLSLFLLLGSMGYKIGINDSILKNFTTIGKKSLIFGLLTSSFSVISTFLFFKCVYYFSQKKGGNKC